MKKMRLGEFNCLILYHIAINQNVKKYSESEYEKILFSAPNSTLCTRSELLEKIIFKKVQIFLLQHSVLFLRNSLKK